MIPKCVSLNTFTQICHIFFYIHFSAVISQNPNIAMSNTRLLPPPTGYSRKCRSCGMTHYPSSSPVGIVLVTDPEEENIILVRQPRHPPGMYSCIAGFSDVGRQINGVGYLFWGGWCVYHFSFIVFFCPSFILYSSFIFGVSV